MRKFAVVIFAIGLVAAVYYGIRHGSPLRVLDLSPQRANPGLVRGAASNAKTLQQAPALTLVDLGGNRIDASSLAGKVVLVNFWAAWCTPCTDEVPKLVALQDKYRAQGLRVIGISMEDRESALREFYRKNKMNYPVVAGNEKISEAYGGILGLPTSFLISRDGSIRAKYPGLADFPKLEREIIALLQTNQ